MVGNAAKAGVRFLSYDTFKSALADDQVCTVAKAYYILKH
jgi:hypothetical protein